MYRAVAFSLFLPILLLSLWGQGDLSYTKDIAPLMLKRCVACHGPDKQEHSLRLDSYEAILRGDKKGAVLVPGTSGESRLYLTVTGKREPKMPPEPFPPLTKEEIELLKRWIDAGAPSDGPLEPKREESPPPPLSLRLLHPAFAAQPHYAVVTVTAGEAIHALAWDSRGKTLGQAKGSVLSLWDTASGMLRARIKLPGDSQILALTFVASNEEGGGEQAAVAVRRRDGSVSLDVVSLPTGQKRATLAEGAYEKVSFSADGRFAALVQKDGSLSLWNLTAEQELPPIPPSGQRVSGLSIGARGTVVATLTEKGQVWVYQGERWSPVPLGPTDAPPAPVDLVLVHPIRAELALFQRQSDGGALEVVSLPQGRPIAKVVLPGLDVRELSWSANGELLACRAQRRVVCLPDGSQRVVSDLFASELTSFAVHPLGRGLAVGSGEGCLWLIDRSATPLALLSDWDDDRWLIVTALGYWSGTAKERVTWSGPFLPKDLSKVRDAWHRTEAVARLLRSEPVPPATVPGEK